MSAGWAAFGAALGDIGGKLVQSAYSARTDYKYKKKLRQSAYSDTMIDMRKAGLNPILAYQTGPTPTSAVSLGAQNAAPGSAAVDAYNSTSVAAEQRKLLREQTEVNRMESLRKAHETESIILRNVSSAMDNKVKSRLMEALLHQAKVQGDTKEVQWLERFLDPIYKIFGTGNSAADMYNKLNKE